MLTDYPKNPAVEDGISESEIIKQFSLYEPLFNQRAASHRNHSSHNNSSNEATKHEEDNYITTLKVAAEDSLMQSNL